MMHLNTKGCFSRVDVSSRLRCVLQNIPIKHCSVWMVWLWPPTCQSWIIAPFRLPMDRQEIKKWHIEEKAESLVPVTSFL